MARKVSVPKGAGPGALLIAAVRAAGATAFCSECYAYVLAAHACPDWTLARPAFNPTTAALAGGLEEVAA